MGKESSRKMAKVLLSISDELLEKIVNIKTEKK
jgi:hypothetical protein